MRLHAFLINNKVVKIGMVSEETYQQESIGYDSLIDVQDMSPVVCIGWVMNGNKLEAPINPEHSGNLKVYSLVSTEYIHLPPNKIDFRMHLHKNLSLNKKGTIAQNGRPVKSEYFYGEEKICEITFEFVDNEYDLMVSRVERLGYCDDLGEINEYFIIHSQTYDVNDPYCLSEMLKERSQSKQAILNEVKGFLNGALIGIYSSEPFNKTSEEITNIFITFWKQYASAFSAFIEVDASALTQAMTDDVDYEFLGFEIAEGVTVRAWLLDRIAF